MILQDPRKGAPPRGQGIWQCIGKMAFDSWEAAWRSIRARKHRRGGRKTEGATVAMRPYRCELCPKWHIGSEAKIGTRKRSKRVGVEA